MIRIALCRKSPIWLPTIFGWLLLLTFISILCVFGARNIYTFLASNDPVGAHTLVVEGWLAPKELDQAIQTFKAGSYSRIVTTGGPTEWPETKYGNYAAMAADYLTQQGISRDLILVVPAPPSAQERTFLSAVMLRESARRMGIKLDAIDLISSGAHARRSRLLFQMALGSKVNIGVLATKPEGFEPETWWLTSKGVESIFFQSVSLIWVKFFFWPPPPGSRQECWSL